ncbi:competence type IV pilus minor pilin ComGF [Sporosarcina beigongshangi]|uniref:competence type IV pilus minor pilin ComGF n=1 Tax=Sporosarcina beigongshangi TaxID=2782538 RepID=UPI00193AB5F7|nr:competence type IV pilus minor pilin ComGF [Sporosarcina beigongshangi]
MKQTDERGYTLLESIFQLLIMALFIHLFILFFFWKDPVEQQYANYSKMQWELFSAELQQLLTEVSEIQLLNGGKVIHFRNHHGSVDIEQSGSVIRKRVTGDGHIPLLTDVRSVVFSLDSTTLTIAVTTVEGTVKVRRFAVGHYPK